MVKIKSGFNSKTTADEVVEGIDLSGRRVVITGGASGIGIETARALARTNAEITLAVRKVTDGQAVAADIVKTTGNKQVYVSFLDLIDLDSVRSFVREFDGPLDILVNNAGVMAPQELQKTPDGLEIQFATNYIGHFALALGLKKALSSRKARIVAVSSSANMFSPVIFDDINFNFRVYDPIAAYGQSKTANVLFAVEASRLWQEEGITVNALHPGAIHTNLQRYVGGKPKTPVELQKSPQQGAATSVFLATSPLVEGIGGKYFEDCNESDTVTHRTANNVGVAPYALDPDYARRLWDFSMNIISGWKF
jgi:NAD(P)-dependent dehydrogenase (short-subunit alcohol dehydrogenase family)